MGTRLILDVSKKVCARRNGPVLLWRLLDEEKILNAQLRGYTEYTQKVRYRLIPSVW